MKAFDAPRVAGKLAAGALVAVPLAVLGLVRGAWWLAAAALGALAIHALAVLHRPLRRRRALREPFPERWRALLDERVCFYRMLDETHRRRFEDDVRIVLADYRFEGVRGTEVDEETRLLAAAGAAMLVHGRPAWEYPAKRSIVVYPGSFDDEYDYRRGGHIAGMVQHKGAIVFSKNALRHGFSADSDGHNVALHEFAHVLDLEDGRADGIPGMLPPHAIEPWLELMKGEMDKVRGGESKLRSYAGKNDAELFAVAVELFFERPARMKEHHPELYDALAEYFGVDPATLCGAAEA